MAAIVGIKGSVSAYVGTAEALTAEDRMTNVTTVTFPTSEAEEIDVTDFDSEGKETENGDVDYGTVEITQHLNTGDQYDDMQDLVDSGEKITFMIFVKNKAGEIVIGRKGKGTVKSVSPEGLERNSAFTVKTTIKVSGKTEKVEAEPAGV